MSTSEMIAAGLWLVATLLLAVFALLGVDPQVRLYYSNALQTLSSLISAGCCFYAMNAFPPGGPLRRVWAVIGFGVLAWGIGATIFSSYPLLNNGADTPYPYFSDIGYLLASPLMVIGLLLFKRATGLVTPVMGQVAGVGMMVIALSLSVRANLSGLNDPDMMMKLTSIGYTLFDPVLLAVTVMTAFSFSGGEIGKAWWNVVIGILFYFGANQAYTYLVAEEKYMTGSPIDMGWMLGFGFIALAALKTRKMML